MNRRLINETAFNMTRILLGMVAHVASDEEHRRLFEQVFKTCKAGLESYCREDQRMQFTLNPMGGSDVPAAAQ